MTSRLRLGADVPVCLDSAPARMGGIGEILSPAPRLPRFGMVLVNPGVAVPTPAVFRARQGRFRRRRNCRRAGTDAAAMARDLARTNNDLQAAAIGLQPVIGEVLARAAKTAGRAAGADERLGRDLLRAVRNTGRGKPPPPQPSTGRNGGAGAGGFTSRHNPTYERAHWDVAKW